MFQGRYQSVPERAELNRVSAHRTTMIANPRETAWLRARQWRRTVPARGRAKNRRRNSDQDSPGPQKVPILLNNNDRRQRGDTSPQKAGKKDEGAENDEDPRTYAGKSRVSTPATWQSSFFARPHTHFHSSRRKSPSAQIPAHQWTTEMTLRCPLPLSRKRQYVAGPRRPWFTRKCLAPARFSRERISPPS